MVEEGGRGDSEVGKSKQAGEHMLMQQWVRVVGETARWADMWAHACTCEGG